MSTVLESLNRALHKALASDARVYLLGEDLLDPYGGAFKVTRGLSSAYPDRVLTTPISEAGITGLATGMALRGLLPVLEIMFGDFVPLIADQLINHATKFRWMYNEQVRVPLVIRTPMGGRRGYGPTHSQTLEKLFLGVPCLRILAPCALGEPGSLLLDAIFRDEDPVLFIENKLLYLVQVQSNFSQEEFDISEYRPVSSQIDTRSEKSTSSPLGSRYAPGYVLALRAAPPPILTIAAYGHMAELARHAAIKLAYEHEIFVELVVPTQLMPLDLDLIATSVRKTARLLVVEEGTRTSGWGAEVIARMVEENPRAVRNFKRLGALDMPVPASSVLEVQMLPQIEDIIKKAREMV